MLNKKINLGLVGTGYLGKFHLQQIKNIDEINFVGIYDLDSNLAKKLGKENNVPVFASVDKLITTCNALSIVVPTNVHHEVAMKGIAGGCHLFIEKPIASSVKLAEEIVQQAKSKDLTLQVGHIERFNPVFIEAERYATNVKSVKSQRMTSFSNRGSDVSVVLDLMIHDIDLCLSLVDSDIESIQATGSRTHTNSIDHGIAHINFRNGATSVLEASRSCDFPSRKMQINGDKNIRIDFLNKTLEVNGSTNQFIKTLDLNKVNPLRDELQHFAQSVISFSTPKVSGSVGAQALKVAYEIEHKIMTTL